MELIPISTLNDFIFCPYSIYLHNVYMDTDEGNYHATPQTRGRNAHQKIDTKQSSGSKDVIEALSIISQELGVYGKIDIYNKQTFRLVERKYQLKNIYRGQIYQLWSQYFCLIEMGYYVKNISFYEISTRKFIEINIPTHENKEELIHFIESYRNYNPKDLLIPNFNKCAHCIYSNLCDKFNKDNVFT